jgi:hypothetical protein
MNAQRQVEALLSEHGYELVRQRKHKVFRRSDGKIWVLPKTPSDFRSLSNNLANLKKELAGPVDAIEPVAAPVQHEELPAPKEIPERNIGIAADKYYRMHRPQAQSSPTQQIRPAKAQLIDLYQVGSVLRKVFGLLIEEHKPGVREFYDKMHQRYPEIAAWDDLNTEQYRKIHQRIHQHNDNLDLAIIQAAKIFQRVVRRMRDGHRVKMSNTRNELITSFERIFRDDPICGHSYDKFALFLSNELLEERKLVAEIAIAIEVRWTANALEYRTLKVPKPEQGKT